MSEEKVISSRMLFAGKILKLRVDTVQMPGGRQSTREVIEHGDCIGVIPVDPDGNLLLVNQFREAVGKELLEIPAGGIEPGENPDAAVIREMQEETGYRPGKMEKLGGFYLAPGYSTEYLHLFLATGLTAGRLYAEDTASIKLVPVKPGEVPGLIASGRICDSKSIAGLLLFLEHQKSGN